MIGSFVLFSDVLVTWAVLFRCFCNILQILHPHPQKPSPNHLQTIPKSSNWNRFHKYPSALQIINKSSPIHQTHVGPVFRGSVLAVFIMFSFVLVLVPASCVMRHVATPDPFQSDWYGVFYYTRFVLHPVFIIIVF